MKQEEFEWLKNWLTEVIIDFRSELNINKIFNDANEKYPPPIDKLSFATTLHCHKHHTNFEDKCPGCEKEKVPRQERKEGDPCNFPTLKTIPVPCPRPLKRCSCGILDCDDTSHNGHAHPIEPNPQKQLTCPDCGTITMGIGGQGAYYFCILCKKRWDFDWENLIVLNPQPNIRPTVPGMKERKEEPKPGQYEGTVCAKCHQRDCKCPERCPKCHNWGKYCKCKPDLKVRFSNARCLSHQRDFIHKDGDYYCPKCFPEGFATIDKGDLEFFVNCKTFRDNPPKTEVPCPCCGRPVEPPK